MVGRLIPIVATIIPIISTVVTVPTLELSADEITILPSLSSVEIPLDGRVGRPPESTLGVILVPDVATRKGIYTFRVAATLDQPVRPLGEHPVDPARLLITQAHVPIDETDVFAHVLIDAVTIVPGTPVPFIREPHHRGVPVGRTSEEKQQAQTGYGD